MKSISLAVFRNEVADCNRFVLTTKDAFSPIDVSVTFDSIHICVSASQYICLRNDCSQVVVKHIKSIKPKGENAGMVYTITCSDYRRHENGGVFEFDLECVKIS